MSAMPTLADLRRMESELFSLEQRAKKSNERAQMLRQNANADKVLDYLSNRLRGSGYDYLDLDATLRDAMVEFGPAILEVLAKRQDLAAHQAMTEAVMKRAELGTFVQLEVKGGTE